MIQIVVLLSFWFSAASQLAVLISIVLLGLSSFATVPPLQLLVVEQAKLDAPQSVDIASGLNIAAFNLGITIGAAIGGSVVSALGLLHTSWIGAILLIAAFGLVFLYASLQQKQHNINGLCVQSE